MKKLKKQELQTLLCLYNQLTINEFNPGLEHNLNAYLYCLNCQTVSYVKIEDNKIIYLRSSGNATTASLQSFVADILIQTKNIAILDYEESDSLPLKVHIIPVNYKIYLILICKETSLSKNLIQEIQKLNQKYDQFNDLQESVSWSSINDKMSIKNMMFDHIPYLMWTKDRDGRYLSSNNQFNILFGIEQKDIIGQTDFDLFKHSQATFYKANDDLVLKHAKTILYEENIFLESKDSFSIFEIIKGPLINSNQEIIGIFGISREVTQNTEMKKAYSNAQKRFEDLSNLLPMPVWETDAIGQLKYLNAAGLQLFEKDKEEITGLNLFSLMPEEYHQSIFELMNYGSDINESIEIECYGKDQVKIPIMFYGNNIKNDDILVGYRGSLVDISSQKNVENELWALSRLQNLLIRISTEYINVPIHKIDDAIRLALKEIGEFVDADRAYIFEYNHLNKTTSNTYEWCSTGIEPQIENLQAIPFTELPKWIDSHFSGETIYIDDVEELIDQDLKAILQPQGIKSLITVPMMHKNKCVGFVGFDSVRKRHFYTQQEKITLEVFAQVLVNIQLRSQQENELKRAKEQAEHAEKAQFNFLSTMSHEIRTPLNAVIGLTNILLMDKPKDSQIKNLNTLKQSSNNLLKIINDILDFNKLNSGNVVLEHRNFNILEVLNTINHSFYSIASNKGIDFKFIVSEEIPKILIGDSNRIIQIINNLLTNSLKFTKKGHVIMEVELLEKIQSEVLLHFSIEDTGIGIPKDKYQEIFEEFRQSNESITREFGGTGLGLPIVRKLLMNMNSDIYVESELDKGSVFSFSLRLPIGDQSYDSKTDTDIDFDDSLAGMKILVVEDNKVNQLVVTEFLMDWKCKIDIADNGLIALEKVEANPYDAILMDLHMPVLDGYEATKRIRSLEVESKRNIPIIALSASALGEIEVRAKKFGMDAFVTKPFVPRILFKTLYQHRQ